MININNFLHYFDLYQNTRTLSEQNKQKRKCSSNDVVGIKRIIFVCSDIFQSIFCVARDNRILMDKALTIHNIFRNINLIKQLPCHNSRSGECSSSPRRARNKHLWVDSSELRPVCWEERMSEKQPREPRRWAMSSARARARQACHNRQSAAWNGRRAFSCG